MTDTDRIFSVAKSCGVTTEEFYSCLCVIHGIVTFEQEFEKLAKQYSLFLEEEETFLNVI